MAPSARAKAEELERLLAGGSVRDDTPADLRRLAMLATTVTEASPVPTPSPQFREALRERLLAADLQVAPTLPQRIRGRVDDATARWKYSARAAVASALASTMIGTTGVAVAAQAALPGDLLYGVKRGTEAVRLAFAATDVEAGRLNLAFARERLDEITTSATARSQTDLGPVFVDMDEASAAGANHILQAAASGNAVELTEELLDFTEQQRARLLTIVDVLPESLRPAVERSLEVLRRIEVQSAVAMDPACTLCREISPVTGAPLPPQVFLPGDGPAAASPDCDCAGDDPDPAPRDPDVVGGGSEQPDGSSDPNAPEGDGGTDAEPTDPDDPANGDTDVVPGLPGPLDDVGDTVDDTIDEVGDQTGTSDVISEVDSIVDEIIGGDTDPLDQILPSEDPLEDPLGGLLPSDDPTGGLLP
jgi:hypothetical protein